MVQSQLEKTKIIVKTEKIPARKGNNIFFSQRKGKVIEEGKDHVGAAPLGTKHSWLLRKDLCLSPLNLALWNLCQRQELSLEGNSWIPLVKEKSSSSSEKEHIVGRWKEKGPGWKTSGWGRFGLG